MGVVATLKISFTCFSFTTEANTQWAHAVVTLLLWQAYSNGHCFGRVTRDDYGFKDADAILM